MSVVLASAGGCCDGRIGSEALTSEDVAAVAS